MDHRAVIEVLGEVLRANAESRWIVGFLALMIVLIMRTMLPRKGLALVFAPGIVFGGLAGIYAMRALGVALMPDRTSNLVATATLGMMGATVLMLLLTRLVDAATRIRRPLKRPAAAAEGRSRL